MNIHIRLSARVSACLCTCTRVCVCVCVRARARARVTYALQTPWRHTGTELGWRQVVIFTP